MICAVCAGFTDFKNKFCQACICGLDVPAARVRALTEDLMGFISNTNSSGFWKTHRAEVGGGIFRVINNTTECIGPQLAIFNGEVPVQPWGESKQMQASNTDEAADAAGPAEPGAPPTSPSLAASSPSRAADVAVPLDWIGEGGVIRLTVAKGTLVPSASLGARGSRASSSSSSRAAHAPKRPRASIDEGSGEADAQDGR